MKKIKIIFLIFLSAFIVNNSFSQLWTWSHPEPQGNTVRSAKLFFNNVYMCGNGGMFGRTSNGGNNWYVTHQAAGIPTQFQTDLFGAHYFDTSNIIACGANATVSKTSDGGIKWTLISTGLSSTVSLQNITFYNSNTGYACGSFGTVIRSSNGGLNWQNVSPTGVTTPINKLYIKDPNTVYGAGFNGTIYFSFNAGMNWSTYSTGTTSTLLDVVFSDANTGITAGTSGAIRKTTNGGVNWFNSNMGAPTVSWNDISYNNGEFFAAGGSNFIIHSTDIGANWQQINTVPSGQNATGTLFAIDKLSNELIVAGTSGIINYSSNNGSSWSALGNKLYSGIFRNFVFRNTRVLDEIYAVGTYSSTTANSALLYSSNNGMDWSNSKGNPITTNLNTITISPDQSTLYAAGDGGKIYKSIGGRSVWDLLTTGTTVNFNDISFIDNNTGYVAGNSGNILKTSNGGDNFTFVNVGTNSWRTVCFVDPNTGWVGGTPLALQKTINGGTNWVLQTTGLQSITQITMLDAQTGFVSGGDANFFGALKKTTTGGDNWLIINVPEFLTSIVSFDIKDDGQCIIISGTEAGKTAITNNGANDWTTVFTGNSSINKVKFDNIIDAWLAGGAGNIMKLDSQTEFILDVNSYFSEGFYDAATNTTRSDSGKVNLRNFTSPYAIIDSDQKLIDNNGYAAFTFSNVSNGIPYYIVMTHRNSIETWSSTGVTFLNGSASYNFSTSASQAFGNNMKQVDTLPNLWGDYGGDINQDGIVDAADYAAWDNDAFNFATGYVNTDLTGDEIVDASDGSIVDNNAFNFVSVVRP